MITKKLDYREIRDLVNEIYQDITQTIVPVWAVLEFEDANELNRFVTRFEETMREDYGYDYNQFYLEYKLSPNRTNDLTFNYVGFDSNDEPFLAAFSRTYKLR